jgi:hypothetical protein
VIFISDERASFVCHIYCHVSGLSGLLWIEYARRFTSSIWSYMLVFIALVVCNLFFDSVIIFYQVSDSLTVECWDGN